MMPLKKAVNNQDKRRLNLMTEDKMIYDDDNTIGVDYRSYEKLEAIAERILNGYNSKEDINDLSQ